MKELPGKGPEGIDGLEAPIALLEAQVRDLGEIMAAVKMPRAV